MAKRKVKGRKEQEPTVPEAPGRRRPIDLLFPEPAGREPLLGGAVDFADLYKALPDGKDAVPKALEGVERLALREALPDVSLGIMVPVLSDEITGVFKERRARGFPNRGLGVLVLRSHHGVSHAEVLTPAAEEGPLCVSYDASEVCDAVRGTAVDAVITAFNMNPVAGDVRRFIEFRRKVREELGADTPVYIAGVHGITEESVNVKIFALHPDAPDGDVVAELDRCDALVEDFRRRWNATTHNMEHTKLTTPVAGEGASDVFERIARERKKFAQEYYERSFGRDEESRLIPAKLDQSIVSLRQAADGRLSERTDQVLAFIAQSIISQSGVNNLLFRPNLVVSVAAPLSGIGRVANLPSFEEGGRERAVLNVGQAVAEELGAAVYERSGYRGLGWMVSHVRGGESVLEFARPEFRSQSEYSSDFDESWVVGKLGENLEDPRVFMVYAGTPTATDYVNYRNATSRIRERCGSVPVYLASAVQLSEHYALFRACRPNPEAPPDGVEDVLRLARIIDDDFMARAGLEASGISRRTRTNPTPDEVYAIMTGRANSAATYVDARFGDAPLSGEVRRHVVSLADYMRARKGSPLELSDEASVAYEAVVDVAQATFRKALIETHAVEEVELVDADGVALETVPIGPQGIRYRDVYRLLAGGRVDVPSAVRTYSGIAMRFDANPVFLKPLVDDAFSYRAETVSDATLENLLSCSGEVNGLLSRRLAHSEQTDKRICAVLARGVEKGRLCVLNEERLPPRVNDLGVVKGVLEEVFRGELSQRPELEGLRAGLAEHISASTERSVERLLEHEPSLAVHCDAIAGALIGRVGELTAQIGREAAQADGIARMSNRDLTARFGGKTKRTRTAFNPETMRDSKRREAEGKRELVGRLSAAASPLKPPDDFHLIRREIVSEAIEAYRQGDGSVRLDDVTALAKDFGMEDMLEAELGTPEQLAAKLKAGAEEARAAKTRLVSSMAGNLAVGASDVRSRRDGLMARLRAFVGEGGGLEGVETLTQAVEVGEQVAEERRRQALTDRLITEMAGGNFKEFHGQYGVGTEEKDKAELAQLPLADMKRLCDERGLSKPEMLLLFWTLREVENPNLTVGGVRSAVERLSGALEQPIRVVVTSTEVGGGAHMAIGGSEHLGPDGQPLHGLLFNIDHLSSLTDADLSAWTDGFVENMRSARRQAELAYDETLAGGWEAACVRLNAVRYADMVSGDLRKKKEVGRAIIRLEDEPQRQGARDVVKQMSALMNGEADAAGLVHHMRKQALALEERGVTDEDVPALARDYVLAEKMSDLLGASSDVGSGLTGIALEVVQLSETKMGRAQRQRFDELVTSYGEIVEML